MAEEQRIADAISRKVSEAMRQQEDALRQHARVGWLYKRGGFAKVWKKRYCVVDRGVLSYYVNEADKAKGKRALGALVLTNAMVRRPTALGSKPGSASLCLDPMTSGVCPVPCCSMPTLRCEGGYSCARRAQEHVLSHRS